MPALEERGNSREARQLIEPPGQPAASGATCILLCELDEGTHRCIRIETCTEFLCQHPADIAGHRLRLTRVKEQQPAAPREHDPGRRAERCGAWIDTPLLTIDHVERKS